MTNKQVFRDAPEDKTFRPGPDTDDDLPTNTGMHRFMGALLGFTFFLGGFDLFFHCFHLFTSKWEPPTSMNRVVGSFFVVLGAFLVWYVLRAARLAHKKPVGIIITGIIVLGIFILPIFFPIPE